MKPVIFTMLAILCVVGCNEQGSSEIASSDSTSRKNESIACPPGNNKLDIATIEQVTGMKGVEKNGEYKITVPQNDLKIVVDGFKITPPMGLGTWVAFTPCG